MPRDTLPGVELLLVVIILGVLVACGVWLSRTARPALKQPREHAPRTRSRRLQRLWWPQADEPVPRPRWSSLPPR